MLDGWTLRIFVTVAERGSLSGAAEDLLLSQPAVSRQIANLERRLGVELFRRTARGVSLTDAGTAALEHARSVLARMETLEATVRTFAGLAGSQVSIAGFASVNTHFVPEAIHRLASDVPEITVTLEQVESFGALRAVADGRLDVALVTDWHLVEDPWEARTNPDSAVALDPDGIDGVELTRLIDEQFHIALAAGHRLAHSPRVELAALRDERWVDGAHPDCLGPLPQVAAALGGPPLIGFMCDDWNGKQALVAGGAGIMVVPTLAAAALRGDLVVRPTSPVLPTRRLFAATARPPFRTPAADALLTTLVAVAEDVGTSPRVDS